MEYNELQFKRHSEYPSAFRINKIENYLAKNYLSDFEICKLKLTEETTERLQIYFSYQVVIISILGILLLVNIGFKNITGYTSPILFWSVLSFLSLSIYIYYLQIISKKIYNFCLILFDVSKK